MMTPGLKALHEAIGRAHAEFAALPELDKLVQLQSWLASGHARVAQDYLESALRLSPEYAALIQRRVEIENPSAVWQSHAWAEAMNELREQSCQEAIDGAGASHED